ncbi:MAG TPA: hypothetical protein VI260_11270 [Blastocatellia bacterium]|jgi:hypothetical protein
MKGKRAIWEPDCHPVAAAAVAAVVTQESGDLSGVAFSALSLPAV